MYTDTEPMYGWESLPWFRNRPEDMPAVNAAERAYLAAGRPAKPAGHGTTPWRRLLRSRRAVEGLLRSSSPYCAGFRALLSAGLLIGCTTAPFRKGRPFHRARFGPSL